MDQNQQNFSSGSSPWLIVGYIIPILFFIPLNTPEGKDPFVRFHAGQQLNLLILWIIVYVLHAVLSGIPAIGIIFNFVYLIPLVLMIIGIMNASSKQQKPLPLIGGFRFIK